MTVTSGTTGMPGLPSFSGMPESTGKAGIAR